MSTEAPASALSRLKARWAKLRERRWVRWGSDAVLLLAAVLVIGAFQTRSHVSGPAPAFTLPALSGGTSSTAALAGKPTMVVFWAPWCGVCGSQSGNVGSVQKLLGDRVNVVSIATAFDDVAEVNAYVSRNGVTYPVLLGPGAIQDEWKVAAFPTVYFLSSSGEVKRSAVGYTTTLGMLWRLVLP